ncbi:MAG TPA: gamma-glutamylcyclotransferase family protein [Candidatus Lokiarchaeia archaeon]|nr:gamma-glutamylcyclotransferase family protein [Candidatus Lokiarchaeia archaeon]
MSESSEVGLTAIIAYGTLITHREFRRGQNVEPCLVMGYRRVLPPKHWYPFVIPASNDDGFWALKFDVPPDMLEIIDLYEGVPTLYYRQDITVQLRSGENIQAQIYLPTEKTIEDFHLAVELDPRDRWLNVLKQEVPDLLALYPELESGIYTRNPDAEE